MKVSINWLKELVDLNIDANSLGEKFSLMSQEVASVEKLVEVKNITVGHVLSKEKHPDANKLSICQVDVGRETLQIICGAPNIDSGQKVIVALPGAVLPGNFKIKKSKIRGEESYGMICSLDELGIEKKYHNEDGIHVLPSNAPIGEDPLKVLCFDDEVIELDLTPNRADLLSMLGVAYDTGAIINKKVKNKAPHVVESNDVNDINIKIETDKCHSYYARVIKNIEIKESPMWMKARLIAAGVRPINNVVDITNYVMLETGQPLHAFDYDKFNSNTVLVRNANNKEVIKTLDGQDRLLLDTDILITDGKSGVALGGVMGGYDTEVDKSTKTILLESAVFDNISIRKTSRRLDLRSESSQRFERIVDPNKTILALERATELFIELADGKVLKGISSIDNTNRFDKEIVISLSIINKILGYNYSLEDIKDVFNRLDFKYALDNESFKVYAPTRRQDIKTYQDLIEEIVRINGYDKIPLTLPKTVSKGSLSNLQIFRRKTRNILKSLGLNETVTYSLINEKNVYDLVTEEKPFIRLNLPMSEDRAVLRHTPLNGMIDSLKYNTARKIQDVNLFEIGKRYFKGNEVEVVSGVMSGIYTHTLWQGKKEVVDFFLIKGIIDNLLNELSIKNIEYIKPESTNKNFHPGQTAYLYVDKTYLGFITKVHPRYQKEQDIPGTFIFELEINNLIKVANKLEKVETISKYPKVTRDIALVVDKDINASDILKTIKETGKKVLKDVSIFDLYIGEKVENNKKSIALSLTFQDNEKTLENDDIDKRTNKILKKLFEKYNATLRT